MSQGNIRVLYSFPHKLGADRICYTAWQQINGLAGAGPDQGFPWRPAEASASRRESPIHPFPRVDAHSIQSCWQHAGICAA